jgi:hypothetical protein
VKKKPLIMIWVGMDDPGIVTAGKPYRILYKQRNQDQHYGIWYSYAFKHDDGEVGLADSRLFAKPKPRRMFA